MSHFSRSPTGKFQLTAKRKMDAFPKKFMFKRFETITRRALDSIYRFFSSDMITLVTHSSNVIQKINDIMPSDSLEAV